VNLVNRNALSIEGSTVLDNIPNIPEFDFFIVDK